MHLYAHASLDGDGDAPSFSIVEIERFHLATSQLAQTTLRSVLGMVELDELLAQRDKINQRLQDILDRQTGGGRGGEGARGRAGESLTTRLDTLWFPGDQGFAGV